jgi:hypothetical protein
MAPGLALVRDYNPGGIQVKGCRPENAELIKGQGQGMKNCRRSHLLRKHGPFLFAGFGKIAKPVPFHLPAGNRASEPDLRFAETDHLPVPVARASVDTNSLADDKGEGVENSDLMEGHGKAPLFISAEC